MAGGSGRFQDKDRADGQVWGAVAKGGSTKIPKKAKTGYEWTEADPGTPEPTILPLALLASIGTLVTSLPTLHPTYLPSSTRFHPSRTYVVALLLCTQEGGSWGSRALVPRYPVD